MRTFGVEEELLLVDATSGRPVPAAPRVLSRAPAGLPGSPELTAEIHQEMLEVVTRPHHDALSLAADVRAGRALADAAARTASARAVALATSPLPVQPHPTEHERYGRMMTRFGVLARRSLTCGLHVHVGVESPGEGVGVLDRIRCWLPVLVALSANSPYCDGVDTGYASWRTIAWHTWPSAGPLPVFGGVEAYRAYERDLLAAGVVLDAGMLYFSARLSRAHPTVEVRVADVPLDATVSAAIAAIVRALVDTAAGEWRRGVVPSPQPEAVLRLATWQAALRGAHGPLVDPETGLQQSGAVVVARLLEHVAPALERNGDAELVRVAIGTILEDGTGADVQRAAGADGVAAAVRVALEHTHRQGPVRVDPLERWTAVGRAG